MNAGTRSRNRCSHCKQEGHNRTKCPFDVFTAASLREQYQEHRREQVRLEHERVRVYLREREERRIIEDHQRRVGAYFQEHDTTARNGPGRCKSTIQSILFDNAQDIPDGLYKQLMDALLIKD